MRNPAALPPADQAPPGPDQAGDVLLCALQQRGTVRFPVALVIAHPDDEAIGLGPLLRLMPDLLIVQITDGAPRNGADARAAGFASAQDYAAARSRELAASLRAAGVAPRIVALGAPDQGAVQIMAQLTRDLRRLLAQHRIRGVITHAYEGGHPDHDAAACIVQRACTGWHPAPAVVEAPFYRAGPAGEWVIGRFPDDAGTVIALTPDEQAIRRAMFAAHASQARVLAMFPENRAAFRLSPGHDFSRPPHPGKLLYEAQDWGITGEAWRRWAAEALAA